MEHEVTKAQPLLDAKGRICEEGWARKPLWQYARRAIHANALRIKEWDYYAVVNQTKGYALTATVSDLGYAALFALCYIDYVRKEVSQSEQLVPFPRGTIGLAASSTIDSQVSWANKHLRLAFIKRGEERHIMASDPHLVLPDGSVGLDIDLTLTQPSSQESLNIATSWKENRKAFYLNEKVNCLSTKGTIRRGMETESLLLGEAWGVLDWGRGRWTYQNTWYWASCSTLVENVPFGLNLGYGFSDRSSASENAILYNHVVHKLGEVTFQFASTDAPWVIKDTQGRLDLVFEPAVTRSSHTNMLVVRSDQSQVFGYFSGSCILDDGNPIQLDRLAGFAEQVFNRW
ncbi:MAG: DUF2804 domain-containing protein [Sphaerochaeta sp.]|jgi:hypothetical protein|uniref:DUF2804 domain-containing protein n=1 Tax=Sphaerochaeta sp. TaxID=1972642 RepID=UPI002FCBDA9A